MYTFSNCALSVAFNLTLGVVDEKTLKILHSVINLWSFIKKMLFLLFQGTNKPKYTLGSNNNFLKVI